MVGGRGSEWASKCLDEVLSKVKAKLAEVKVDWARERERVESKLANTKEVAVEKFKALEDFAVEKV